MKEQLFIIEMYDALSKKKYEVPENIIVTEENILLVLHDLLHDMCDKGDQLTITLIKDWSMDGKPEVIAKAHKYLNEGKGHWIKKYLEEK